MAAAAETGVSITHRGRTVRHETGAWSVPKAVLMERMAMAMDQGRLKLICDEMMGRIFAGEARNFVRTKQARARDLRGPALQPRRHCPRRGVGDLGAC